MKKYKSNLKLLEE